MIKPIHILLAACIYAVINAVSHAGPTVPGDVAMLRGQTAYAPANAPEAVKQAIWAVNRITKKPYRSGGGHARIEDSAYDCSGTISYLLHYAGRLASPMPSGAFRNYGKSGSGRWITIFARDGHVFAYVAGLRLDTTGSSEREGPRWHLTPRKTGGHAVRHPEGL